MFLLQQKHISFLRRKNIETNCEVSAVELRFNSAQKTLMLAFYRPPDSSLEFVQHFDDILRKAKAHGFDKIILLGDFNLPDVNWTTNQASSE